MPWYEEVCAVQQTIPETIRKVHWNVGKESKNPQDLHANAPFSPSQCIALKPKKHRAHRQ